MTVGKTLDIPSGRNMFKKSTHMTLEPWNRISFSVSLKPLVYVTGDYLKLYPFKKEVEDFET